MDAMEADNMDQVVLSLISWSVLDNVQEIETIDDPQLHSATDDESISPAGEGSRRIHYTIEFKLKVAIDASAATNISEVARRYGITTRSIFYVWTKQMLQLQLACDGNKRKKFCGQCRPPVFLSADEVVQWM